MFLFQKGQTIANRYSVVFPHKEGAYAETYRVKDSSEKLRFLKLIFTTQSCRTNSGTVLLLSRHFDSKSTVPLLDIRGV